jgi:hypothetical protein
MPGLTLQICQEGGIGSAAYDPKKRDIRECLGGKEEGIGSVAHDPKQKDIRESLEEKQSPLF